MMRVVFTLVVLCIFMPPAWAMPSPHESMNDPVLETRAQALYNDLRCVVCQNQTIGHSDAAIARDMRALVRERLMAGASDQEILNELHTNYGDFVLMRPPVDIRTWVLWGMPFLVFVFGGIAVMRTLKNSAQITTDKADNT